MNQDAKYFSRRISLSRLHPSVGRIRFQVVCLLLFIFSHSATASSTAMTSFRQNVQYVTACNDDGVWNIKRASLYFRIEPAWHQTIWFKVILVLLGIAFLLLLYLFDRRRYVKLLRLRFDERLEERTRLARELHDTLLQTIQGSKIVADYAKTNLDDPARTRSTLECLSLWLDQAI